MKKSSDLEEFFKFKDMQLRKIEAGDIDMIVTIINKAYSYQDDTKGEPRINKQKLQDKIAQTEFYVVLNGTQLTGCVYTEVKEKGLHIGLLTVIDSWRGKGLAPKILTAIVEYATSRDFKSIELNYMSLAPWLRSYYEKYGFKLTGKITPWGTIDLIRMSKSL